MDNISKSKSEKQYGHILLIIVLGLYVFMRSDPLKISVEKNIYDYYSESIVKDHDLNVINQVPEKERWQITSSGNYPDMHSNGVISFWSPFFLYKSLIDSSLPIENKQAIFLTRTMATNFFALISIVLMLYWAKKELGFNLCAKELIIFSLGGSFFWYAIFQPGNADITSLTIALMEIIYFRKIIKENLPIQYFIFGLLLGIGLTVKIDHFFFLLLPGYLFFNLIKNKTDFKLIRKVLLLFSAGYLINLIPLVVNDSIKFGYVDYGYRGVLASDCYLLWENLFYPSGYLNNNPIYIFSFIGLIWLFCEKEKKADLIIIGMIPVVSVMVESFARIHQESYGGRHWIAYLPSLLMLFLYFFKKINESNLNVWVKRGISLIAFFAVLQNGSKLLQSNLNYDKFFWGVNQFQEMVNFFNGQDSITILGMFFNYPLLSIKLTYFLPVIIVGLATAVSLYWFYVVKKYDLTKLIVVVTLVTTISYLAMTLLNIKNNHHNYLTFEKTGLLKNSIIGNGPHIYELYENLGTTEKTISFHIHRKNNEKVEFFKKVRLDYIRRAASEIIYDPIGFKLKLENDNVNFIKYNLRVD